MIKRESKILHGKLFELENHVPDVVRQHIKPMDDKLLMAYSIIDDVEIQVDKIDDKVKKILKNSGQPVEDTESESDSEEGEGDQTISPDMTVTQENENNENGQPDSANQSLQEIKKNAK